MNHPDGLIIIRMGIMRKLQGSYEKMYVGPNIHT